MFEKSVFFTQISKVRYFTLFNHIMYILTINTLVEIVFEKELKLPTVEKILTF